MDKHAYTTGLRLGGILKSVPGALKSFDSLWRDGVSPGTFNPTSKLTPVQPGKLPDMQHLLDFNLDDISPVNDMRIKTPSSTLAVQG